MVDPSCNDLATKAELQELRDQLNQVLGEKEDGSGYVEIFTEAGLTPTSTIVGTAGYFVFKTKAAQALLDIRLDTGSGGTIWQELKNGTAKLTGFRGNGEQVTLEGTRELTKTIGTNAGGAVAGTAIAAKRAAMFGIFLNLLNLAVTLGLNIATVKVLDYRIDQEAKGTQNALDSLNNGMLRLYAKNQEDIARTNADVEANNEKIQQSVNVTRAIEADALQARSERDEMGRQLEESRQVIVTLQSELNEAVNTINENAAEFDEINNQLRNDITSLERELNQSLEVIQQQQIQIEKQAEVIANVEAKIESLITAFEESNGNYEYLKQEFEKLEIDLAEDIEDIQEQVDDLEGKVILTQKWVKQNRSTGGSSAPSTKASADAQTKLLDLTAKLGGQTNDLTITDTDIYNNTNPFKTVFDNLLTNIGGGDVNQEQLDTLRADLGVDFSTLLTTGLTATVIPDLERLLQRTSTDNIARGTEQGICQSLNNPNPCGASGGNAPTQGLKGMKDFLKNQADAIAAGLGLANLGANASILGIVQSTNNIVSNATSGVAATKQFLDKAWNATGADKVLNAITTAMVIHNGVQLSTNLTATVTETASVVLDAMGVEDAQGNPFDVSAILRGKLNSLMTRLVGAENYAALTTKLARYNRIYQSTANVLDATRDLFDSAHSVAELTATNTGRIGNALLEAGVVYEDAYGEMTERVNPQSKALARIEGLRESLDNIEESVSTVSNIASEVVSTRDSYGELIQARDDWKTENETVREELRLEREEVRLGSQAETDVADSDFDAASE